jgi:hypothetical protein
VGRRGKRTHPASGLHVLREIWILFTVDLSNAIDDQGPVGWSLKLVCGDDFLARGEIENSSRLETERVIGVGTGRYRCSIVYVFSIGNKDY